MSEATEEESEPHLECSICHRTMSIDEECDPTDLCHHCAQDEVIRLKNRVTELEKAFTNDAGFDQWWTDVQGVRSFGILKGLQKIELERLVRKAWDAGKFSETALPEKD